MRPIVRIGLSRADVALAIGVSVTSVDLMVKEGFLPNPRKWHSRKIWIISEIERAMAQWPIEGEEEESQLKDWDTWEEKSFPQPIVKDTQKQAAQKRLDDELKLYQSLGSDGYSERYQERHAKWAAALPSEPLNRREMNVLRELAKHGLNTRRLHSEVKDCGPDTQERLTIRGFIGVGYSKKFPDRIDTFWITTAGLKAVSDFDRAE